MLVQTIDMTSEENHTFLELHKYPATEGLSWRPGTNRITAHTDVGLLTLLFPSPGAAISTSLQVIAYLWHLQAMPCNRLWISLLLWHDSCVPSVMGRGQHQKGNE